ncbi:hypothetical protein ASE12_00205 [Aeromicrobium sp. Root236]|uniref:hypothetical protein n=1 Tax=Aeromicrobium sp. Root236 TaxID=1736498 RepID=UPI0006F3C26E|nr:hypothetical protein [Aeromicrobium sp. Root236]KRC63316.1 hypothetical protein ASE12_00205 [Aeromicrobium sp. Root236]
MEKVVVAILTFIAATLPVVVALLSRNRDLAYMREQAATFKELPKGKAKEILRSEIIRSAEWYEVDRNHEWRRDTLRKTGLFYLAAWSLIALAGAVDYYKLDGANPLSHGTYLQVRSILLMCALISFVLALALLAMFYVDFVKDMNGRRLERKARKAEKAAKSPELDDPQETQG